MKTRVSMGLWIGAVVACLLGPLDTNGEAVDRPNLVVIMADDLGYGDLSCYGNTDFETPHLDRMASEGLRFTDYHASGPVCSPTRAGLLTGRYQQRAGIPGVIYADFASNRHHGLSTRELTFAELLRAQGYRTAMYGKWHLGYRVVYNPIHHGFEDFRGYVSGNVDYHAHLDRMGIADWWDGAERKDEPGYTTHLITRHAVAFIRAHHDQPFCLYVAHEAPHDPFQGPDDPPFRQPGKVVPNPKKDIPRAYREMVQTMDLGVGEILDTLRELELAERTLVLFLSDNGGTRHGRNGVLRGHKGSLWEGGHRVPAIAWWPTQVPPNCFCDSLAMSIDIFPTLMELSQASVPQGHHLDGRSLVGALLKASMPPRDQPLFWSYGQKRAMRDGPWKYIEPNRENPSGRLFHLESDLSEQNDLAPTLPARVRAMRQALHAWELEVLRDATKQPAHP